MGTPCNTNLVQQVLALSAYISKCVLTLPACFRESQHKAWTLPALGDVRDAIRRTSRARIGRYSVPKLTRLRSFPPNHASIPGKYTPQPLTIDTSASLTQSAAIKPLSCVDAMPGPCLSFSQVTVPPSCGQRWQATSTTSVFRAQTAPSVTPSMSGQSQNPCFNDKSFHLLF